VQILPDETQLNSHQSDGQTNSGKQKILVIDDAEGIRNSYAQALREGGFEVLEAQDGVEGLEVALKNPDLTLVFTGIQMPRLDGFGLVEALRERSDTAEIPVAINSHWGREADQVRAQELGVSDFVVQGVTSPNELADRFKSLLKEKKEYVLEVAFSPKDGFRFLSEELNLASGGECQFCGGDLNLKVIPLDQPGAYSLGVVCDSCQREHFSS
jgi:two-component system chemotaxis response regulator CheY